MVVKTCFEGASVRSLRWLVCITCIAILVPAGLQAKTVRMDKDVAKVAYTLGKDRDAMLSGSEAMTAIEFKEEWTEFASRLDEFYDCEKDQIRFRLTGKETGYRKDFALLLYSTFKFQGKGAKLLPTPQELVQRHSFLQEIIVDGSVYPNGSSIPRKMKDVVKADFMMQAALRTRLEGWGEKFKKKFEKSFPGTE